MFASARSPSTTSTRIARSGSLAAGAAAVTRARTGGYTPVPHLPIRSLLDTGASLPMMRGSRSLGAANLQQLAEKGRALSCYGQERPMIIDAEPPDAPRRRWPFLAAWSAAAIVIVLALFLTHAPASQQAVVAVSASQGEPASASISLSIGVEQVSVAETLRRSGVDVREMARAARSSNSTMRITESPWDRTTTY